MEAVEEAQDEVEKSDETWDSEKVRISSSLFPKGILVYGTYWSRKKSDHKQKTRNARLYKYSQGIRV